MGSSALLRTGVLILLLSAQGGFVLDGWPQLSGEIYQLREYRHDIGHGLIFVLQPTYSGWMIGIVPETRCAEDGADSARVVNAPYRNYNSLFVDASYGITAKEAVGVMNPRDFSFVASCEDYKRESHRLEIVLWPYNYSQKEADEALAKLGSSPLGKGRFTILDSKVSRAEQDIEGKNYGKIDWMKFRLEIRFPGDQLPPSSKARKSSRLKS